MTFAAYSSPLFSLSPSLPLSPSLSLKLRKIQELLFQYQSIHLRFFSNSEIQPVWIGHGPNPEPQNRAVCLRDTATKGMLQATVFKASAPRGVGRLQRVRSRAVSSSIRVSRPLVVRNRRHVTRKTTTKMGLPIVGK